MKYYEYIVHICHLFGGTHLIKYVNILGAFKVYPHVIQLGSIFASNIVNILDSQKLSIMSCMQEIHFLKFHPTL